MMTVNNTSVTHLYIIKFYSIYHFFVNSSNDWKGKFVMSSNQNIVRLFDYL